jgi:hypothetical protein
MKETNEMMKILSENKKKVQEKDKQLKATKEKAKDITSVIWMCVAGVIIFSLMAQL